VHKVYGFLLSQHDFAQDLTTKALAEQALDWLTEEFLDGSEYEDAWCTPMALIADNGQMIDLAPEDDILGIHAWVRDFIVSAPAGNCLQKALRLAVQMTAIEMELYGCHTIGPADPNEGDKRIDSASREDLIKDILAEIPGRLARLYEEAVGQPRNRGQLGEYLYRCTVRKYLAVQFEEFCASMVPAFTPNPKARPYRCFDLREYPTVPEEEDQLLVLLVDVHE
jgi:hypothetical protein